MKASMLGESVSQRNKIHHLTRLPSFQREPTPGLLQTSMSARKDSRPEQEASVLQGSEICSVEGISRQRYASHDRGAYEAAIFQVTQLGWRLRDHPIENRSVISPRSPGSVSVNRIRLTRSPQ